MKFKLALAKCALASRLPAPLTWDDIAPSLMALSSAKQLQQVCGSRKARSPSRTSRGPSHSPSEDLPTLWNAPFLVSLSWQAIDDPQSFFLALRDTANGLAAKRLCLALAKPPIEMYMARHLKGLVFADVLPALECLDIKTIRAPHPRLKLRSHSHVSSCVGATFCR